ncbi:uncharacterized protein L201_000692 [Kwoniella dendrophila CBS 6074]|uniref:HORMA domain-containing protein n=1 Tax=Kwoniella dendrophila CBS 6074 TaxID=1295534 RepID=A0AAX4JKC1_9TREE
MGPPKQAFRPPAPVLKGAMEQNSSQSQSQSQMAKVITNQDQQIVSKEDSFDLLDVALQASIGIICYLRNLLPEDNFENLYISNSHPLKNKTPIELYSLTKEEAEACKANVAAGSSTAAVIRATSDSQPEAESEAKVFTYRKLRKDASSQGKAISKLLEGAKDALLKGYLQSLMLVILLDKDDPINVIETYSFNFFYHKKTGIPSMQVEHRHGDQSTQRLDDLLNKNERLGTPMTHLEVRRIIKHMAKKLVKECQEFPDLPKKRFMDFKLFYNDTAPSGYNAVGYEDSSSEMMVLATEDVNQPPLRYALPDLQTGHHGLSLTALSALDCVPPVPQMTDEPDENEYARRYSYQSEVEENAKRRNVLWNADMPAHDRFGYDPSANDIYTACIDPSKAVANDFGGTLAQPVGRRQMDGTIVDISPTQKGKGKEREIRARSCRGARQIPEETLQMSQPLSQKTPSRGTTNLSQAEHSSSIGTTLFIPQSQSCGGNGTQSYLDNIDEEEEEGVHEDEKPGGSAIPPNSDLFNDTPPSTLLSSQNLAAALKRKVQLNRAKEVDGMDIDEVRPRPKRRGLESIVSSAMKNNGYEPRTKTQTDPTSKPNPKPKSKPQTKPRAKPKPKPKPNVKPQTSNKPKRRAKSNSPKTQQAIKNAQEKVTRQPPAKPEKGKMREKVDCFCGSNDEDIAMVQCEGCGAWFHAICLGFLDTQTASQTTFSCIPCEMRMDKNRSWPKKDIDDAGDQMANLALTRRVMNDIKTVGVLKKQDIPEVQRKFGRTVAQMKALIAEFVEEGLIDEVDNSEVPAWRWIKSSKSYKKFTSYFKYGKGIELEVFEFRKWHSPIQPETDDHSGDPSPTQTQTQSQRQSFSQSSNPIANSQASMVPDSQPGDVDMENRTASQGNSNQNYTPYKLPEIRSSRSERLIDCTDDWS